MVMRVERLRVHTLSRRVMRRVKSPEKLVFSYRIVNLMTNKIVHHDKNGHITSNFFRFDAMISSLAKVMGLQSRQKQGPK